jgi:hypothetical protein
MTIPIIIHCPLFALDLRKAEYLKVSSASAISCGPFSDRDSTINSTLGLCFIYSRRNTCTKHWGGIFGAQGIRNSRDIIRWRKSVLLKCSWVCGSISRTITTEAVRAIYSSSQRPFDSSWAGRISKAAEDGVIYVAHEANAVSPLKTRRAGTTSICYPLSDP